MYLHVKKKVQLKDQLNLHQQIKVHLNLHLNIMFYLKVHLNLHMNLNFHMNLHKKLMFRWCFRSFLWIGIGLAGWVQNCEIAYEYPPPQVVFPSVDWYRKKSWKLILIIFWSAKMLYLKKKKSFYVKKSLPTELLKNARSELWFKFYGGFLSFLNNLILKVAEKVQKEV